MNHPKIINVMRSVWGVALLLVGLALLAVFLFAVLVYQEDDMSGPITWVAAVVAMLEPTLWVLVGLHFIASARKRYDPALWSVIALIAAPGTFLLVQVFVRLTNEVGYEPPGPLISTLGWFVVPLTVVPLLLAFVELRET